MPNTPISGFSSGAPAQSADEYVVARSGSNFKLAGSDIKTLVIGAGSVSIASGKTLTANNTLTLAGTDSTTMTFPTTSATLARTDAAQTFTGSQTVSGGTITANAPVLNLSQTWNNAGVTFTGVQLTATDTASNASSRLIDLIVGSTSRFFVQKNGDATAARLTLNGSGGFGILFQDGSNRLRFSGSAIIVPAFLANVGFNTNSTGTFGFAPTSDESVAADTILTRRGAANLRFGAADAAAPVAQTLSVQSVVAGTSNTAGSDLTITGSQGTGTGVGGSILFQVANPGSSGTAQNSLLPAFSIIPTTSTETVVAVNAPSVNGRALIRFVNPLNGTPIRARVWTDPNGGQGLTWTGGTNLNITNYSVASDGASVTQFCQDNGFFKFRSAASNGAGGTDNILYVKGDGKVGIGTASPAVALDVNGQIKTNGFAGGAPTIKTANYTQLEADYSLIFNGSGSITLTLLAAATYPGKILYVKTIAAQTVVSASSNVKPIDTDTAGTAILAATAGKWAMLQSDGTNWVIMAQG